MGRQIDPLKAYREVERLSQQDVADALEISRAMVSLLETGERPYTPEMCVLIEKRLGIPRERFRGDIFKQVA